MIYFFVKLKHIYSLYWETKNKYTVNTILIKNTCWCNFYFLIIKIVKNKIY